MYNFSSIITSIVINEVQIQNNTFIISKVFNIFVIFHFGALKKESELVKEMNDIICPSSKAR